MSWFSQPSDDEFRKHESPSNGQTLSTVDMPGSSNLSNIIQNTGKNATSSLPQGSRRSADGRTRRYAQSGEPRLKWSEELHSCFVWVIENLGGPQKATPKAILQEMKIPGLKLAQVKSHLQMYRCSKHGMKNNSSSDRRPGAMHRDSTPDLDPGVWDSEHRTQGSGMREPSQLINCEKISKSCIIRSNQNSGRQNSAVAPTLNLFGCDNHTISNATFHSQNKQQEVISGGDRTPELSEIVHPNLFKIMNHLEVVKSSEYEVLGNKELERRLSPSHQLLAGDAIVARHRRSASLLARDLLVTLREIEYLETDPTFISELLKTCDGAIGSKVPHENVLLGLANSSADVRPDISTLDCTGQFSRSHL